LKTEEEVTGGCRKVKNEELHNLYCSPNVVMIIKSRRFICVGHVSRMEATRNTFKILVREPEGKTPIGRLRHRWEDNIKINLQEVGFEDADWIHLAENKSRWRALVSTVLNIQVL
jgi:hypothetical protein